MGWTPRLTRALKGFPKTGSDCRLASIAAAVALLGGCATAQQPRLAPQASEAAVETSGPVPVEARQQATEHFYRGKALALAGEPACARQEFQDALDTFRTAARPAEPDDLAFGEQLYESVSLYDRRAAGSERAPDERPAAESRSDSLVAQPPSARPDEMAAAQKEIAAAAPAAAFDIPIVVNDRVLKAVAFYQFRTPRAFAAALQRSGRYLPLLRQLLREQGLPQDLAYVAMIESAFKSGAHSRKSAHGFWQFIDGTARRYGLRKTREIDERSDIVKSTKAAAAYFRDLYEMFGDWPLAMAAYDTGEGRILRALQATGAKDYWELSAGNALLQETRDYVPFVFAAALITREPTKFGFDVVPDPPLAFDVAEIDRRVDLSSVARVTGTTTDEIENLNSELRLRTTPRGRYALRVPPGKAETLLASLSQLPAPREVAERSIVVRRGDTLARIARRHHVSVSELCEWNDLTSEARPKKGTVLVLLTRGARKRAPAATTAAAEGSAGPRGEIRAIPTPSAAITSAAQIADVGAAAPAEVPMPQSYQIGAEGFADAPARETVAAARPTAPRGRDQKKVVYTVRRGDTLFHIAQQYGVSVQAIRKVNRLGHREMLEAGRRLTLVIAATH